MFTNSDNDHRNIIDGSLVIQAVCVVQERISNALWGRGIIVEERLDAGQNVHAFTGSIACMSQPVGVNYHGDTGLDRDFSDHWSGAPPDANRQAGLIQ